MALQQVKISVKNGAWWIGGNDTQGSLRAKVLRVSLTGNLPAIPTEAADPNPLVAKNNTDRLKVELREWRNGMPKDTRLMGKDEGIAIFGGATASFNGWGERILIAPGDGDDWNLQAHASPHLDGYANCVTGLPNGWFDVKSATATECSLAYGPAKRKREMLCSESDGVCWLTGMSGVMGGGEAVRVFREEGNWFVEVDSAGSEISAWAVACPFGKSVDPFRSFRIVEVVRRPRPAPAQAARPQGRLLRA